jgi:adenylate kinase
LLPTEQIMSVTQSLTKLTKNVTILGAPGSGKGFYGRPLAAYFQAPFWTVSTVLRESGMDTTTGHLLDDQQVSSTVLDYIQNHSSHKNKNSESLHYVLDGYPRTPRQIQLMEAQWPLQHQAHLCLQLDVPDEVCQAKMLGRRQCRKCGTTYNIANVQYGDFDLPPQLPDSHCAGCQSADWLIRADDTLEVIQHRLQSYRAYESEILDYYRKQGRLLQFTPYKGEMDLPRLCQALEQWMAQTSDN